MIEQAVRQMASRRSANESLSMGVSLAGRKAEVGVGPRQPNA
jgi:hypothetical protein